MKYDAENPGLGQEQEKYDIIIYYLNKLFDFIFLLMAGFLPDIQSGSFLLPPVCDIVSDCTLSLAVEETCFLVCDWLLEPALDDFCNAYFEWLLD